MSSVKSYIDSEVLASESYYVIYIIVITIRCALAIEKLEIDELQVWWSPAAGYTVQKIQILGILPNLKRLHFRGGVLSVDILHMLYTQGNGGVGGTCACPHIVKLDLSGVADLPPNVLVGMVASRANGSGLGVDTLSSLYIQGCAPSHTLERPKTHIDNAANTVCSFVKNLVWEWDFSYLLG
jgi:hypothetical protein